MKREAEMYTNTASLSGQQSLTEDEALGGDHEFASVAGCLTVFLTVFEGTLSASRVAQMRMTEEQALTLISELRAAVTMVRKNKRLGRKL
jgi:hypothetical protein